MTNDDVRNRITELRKQKNVSEYRMSQDLGKSKGYIQSIT
ncbi:MAG: transcriptional regulator, partial [Lachnospiraceae bacterium]|nr:transcriptional regulator [Lachnospiraceae bacterium]